jgi:hypothetical protein
VTAAATVGIARVAKTATIVPAAKTATRPEGR